MHTSKRPALVVEVSVIFMRRISPVEQSPAAVLETREKQLLIRINEDNKCTLTDNSGGGASEASARAGNHTHTVEK